MQHECKENSSVTWAQYLLLGGIGYYWMQRVLYYFGIESVDDAIKIIGNSREYFQPQVPEKVHITPCPDFNDFLGDIKKRFDTPSFFGDDYKVDETTFPRPAFGTKYACPDQIFTDRQNRRFLVEKMVPTKQDENIILEKYKKFEGLTVAKFSTAVSLSGYSIHILNVNGLNQPNAKVFSNKVIGVDISSLENTVINRDTIGNCIVTKVRNIGGFQNR